MRVDRLHAGGIGAEQAHRARELVGELVLAAVDAVGAGADRGRQVFGAPREAHEPRRRIAIGVEREHRLRRLGGDRHDADRAGRDALALLERGEVVIEQRRCPGADSTFGSMMPSGAPPTTRDEVGHRQRRRQRIDAHPELLPRRGPRAPRRYSVDHAARDLDAVDRHRVFEVEDQRAGGAVDCALAIFFSLSPGTNSIDFSSGMGGRIVAPTDSCHGLRSWISARERRLALFRERRSCLPARPPSPAARAA